MIHSPFDRILADKEGFYGLGNRIAKFEKIIIPERTYAVFETGKQKLPIPEYVDIRKQIAAEWLSGEEYQLMNAPELAVYHWGIVGGCADRTIEIWIPIEKK